MSNSDQDTAKLLKSALHYLKYRLRTVQEIEAFLSRKYPQTDAQNIHTVIGQLKELDLLNDQRFSQEWIRSQLNKGKGPFIIKHQLKKLGIAPDLIETSLHQLDDRQLFDSARAYFKRKAYRFNKLNNSLKPLKIKQYLYQRGYPYQIVNAVIDDYLSKE